MSAMLVVVVALLLGTLSGGLAGGLASRWLLTRLTVEALPAAGSGIDPDLDEQIRQAASRWAEAHHRPGAASLVADKLRLVYVLRQRGGTRRRSSW